MKIERPKLLIFSVLVCQMAGIIGSFATAPAIAGWYASLNKPAFNPPNWIFGPVWITLYTLMGTSLYLVLLKGWSKKEVKFSSSIFVVHLAVNSFWSVIFFGLHNLALAFGIIIILWLMIAYLIRLFARIDKRASYLLVPYLLWVSFASLLNYFIWQLN